MIQANTGVIAHHGYQRPGQGWQTASCFGARYVSYEVGHDALDAYIPYVQHIRETRIVRLSAHVRTPPESMSVVDEIVKREPGSRFRSVERKTTVYPRPEGFVALTEAPDYYTPRSYEKLWWGRRSELEREIESMTHEIDRATERRAAWKQPS